MKVTTPRQRVRRGGYGEARRDRTRQADGGSAAVAAAGAVAFFAGFLTAFFVAFFAVFLAVFFVAFFAAFLALVGAISARARNSATASGSVSSVGSVPRGTVALTVPSVTYGP